MEFDLADIELLSAQGRLDGLIVSSDVARLVNDKKDHPLTLSPAALSICSSCMKWRMW